MENLKNNIFAAKIEKQTEKAYCLSFDYGDKIYKNVWFPKSQVKITKEYISAGYTNEYDLFIPFWLMAKTKPTSYYPSSNGNSVWCSIFAKQDANGLTENGYAL